MRLAGSAGELARTATGDEILNGAVYEGVSYDPVGYILARLRGLWQLEEEKRLAAMMEMLAFHKVTQASSSFPGCRAGQPGPGMAWPAQAS